MAAVTFLTACTNFVLLLQDAIMSLEIHNQTLYRGMSDMMYRTIDREVWAAWVNIDYFLLLSFRRKATYILELF